MGRVMIYNNKVNQFWGRMANARLDFAYRGWSYMKDDNGKRIQVVWYSFDTITDLRKARMIIDLYKLGI